MEGEGEKNVSLLLTQLLIIYGGGRGGEFLLVGFWMFGRNFVNRITDVSEYQL